MSKRKKEYAIDVLKREIEERKMKLKPCPFCNGEADIEGIPEIHYISCKNCYAETRAYRSKAEAIKAWNKRVDVAKTENATCKKSLQVSRSDIEKMVKLEWVKYRENGWCAFINFRRIYSARIKIIEEIVYSIYFEDLYLEDYKICSSTSLEEAQTFAKEWLVDLICSALCVEE